MPGLIAKKIGMTQVFNKEGHLVPVTVLKAGPCSVVLKRTKESNGYEAIQIGFEEVDAKKENKPYAGHFTKKNSKVFKIIREFRSNHCGEYQPGDLLTVNYFQDGDSVDVSGISKGKGFQGVIKRHHFAGGMASHGCSVSHRAAGSIGQRTYPGKVFKNKRMPGRMGGEQVTTKKLHIVGVEPEQNLLLICGSVPGANRGTVLIHPRSDNFEQRFFAGKKKESAPQA